MGWMLGWLFYRHWVGAVAAALIFLCLRPFYEKIRLQNQKSRLYEELKDLLYVLSSGFASGAGLSESLNRCAQMLKTSYGQQGLLWREAEFIKTAMEEGNASGQQLLSELARRSGLPELRQVALVYGLCLETGGDLQRAMIETSDALLRRLQLWQEVQTATAQKRLEFLLMAAMVPLMLIAVNATSDYLQPMYSTLWGRTVMTTALAGWISSILWSFAIVEGGRQ